MVDLSVQYVFFAYDSDVNMPLCYHAVLAPDINLTAAEVHKPGYMSALAQKTLIIFHAGSWHIGSVPCRCRGSQHEC
ncbi:hypothetical protein BDW22DRAFT_1361737 [Trametopsis cervina]|nr:hypothetical protein BDW22DRAFT_1361737 [Trametopsis cervina]